MTAIDLEIPAHDDTVVAPQKPTQPHRRAPQGPARWLRKPATGVALAVLAIAFVHLCNLNGWPIAIDDEGTYVAQAWSLYDGQLAHYTYWYDHPPVGWFQLAFFLAVPHLLGFGPTVELARYVMVGYTVVTALLLYRLTRNVGGKHLTGIAAMLAWGLCPLVLAQGRQVLLDNLTLPWLVGCLVLATNRRQALWQHVAAGACLGVAVLTKETTLLLAPALLVALWTYSYRPTRAFSVVGAAVVGGITISFYPLFAMLRDELLSGPGHVSIQDAVAFQLMDRAGSGTLLDPNSNVRELVDGWFAYDRLLFLTGLIAAVLCLVPRRTRLVAVAVLVPVAMALRPGGYVPAMYVIAILPFAALAAALVFDHAVRRVAVTLDRPRRPAGRVLATVILLPILVMTGMSWSGQLNDAMTQDLNGNRAEAVGWMTTHLDTNSRILVDDSYWNNFVSAGWSGDGWSGPIWYYKLDLDPDAREANLPNGWQDIDYIVMSRTLTDSIKNGTPPPYLLDTYNHSVPVRTWGSGVNAVELRRVVPESPAQTSVTEASE